MQHDYGPFATKFLEASPAFGVGVNLLADVNDIEHRSDLLAVNAGGLQEGADLFVMAVLYSTDEGEGGATGGESGSALVASGGHGDGGWYTWDGRRGTGDWRNWCSRGDWC